MTRHNRTSLAFCSLLILLGAWWSFIPISARAAPDLASWHFYADAIVQPQADNSFEAVYVDFTRLLKRDLKQEGALDENSIRVAPMTDGKIGELTTCRFVKDAKYEATHNAIGTLIFLVAANEKPDFQQYRIFFDTQANGPKPAPENSNDVPAAANMIWNSSFEILSKNYTGPNRFSNVGAKLPQGWWGNLRNSKIPENLATTAHSGKSALAFVSPEAEKSAGIAAAPSPPGVRVVPGQNYVFSFWAHGEKLVPIRTSVLASLYWYDADQKYLQHESFAGPPENLTDFPWTKTEVTMPAPLNAHFVTLRVSTYSTTGLLTVDDCEIRVAVPPLLENAKANR